MLGCKSEFIIGWNAGYAAGYAKGVEDVQQQMKQTMGVYDKEFDPLPPKDVLREDDYKARQQERDKAKGV